MIVLIQKIYEIYIVSYAFSEIEKENKTKCHKAVSIKQYVRSNIIVHLLINTIVFKSKTLLNPSQYLFS